MNQTDRELEQLINEYTETMESIDYEQNMKAAEEKKQEAIKRIIDDKKRELLLKIKEEQHKNAEKISASIDKENARGVTFTEEEQQLLEELKNADAVTFNKDRVFYLATINDNGEVIGKTYDYDSLSVPMKKMVSRYRFFDNNSKTIELKNSFVKIDSEACRKHIGDTLDNWATEFHKMSRNTSPKMIDDIVYNIDTFKEGIDKDGNPVYEGIIDGEKITFADDGEIYDALDRLVPSYQFDGIGFGGDNPNAVDFTKPEEVIQLSTSEVAKEEPVKEEGTKPIQAHTKDVEDMHAEPTLEDDKMLENAWLLQPLKTQQKLKKRAAGSVFERTKNTFDKKRESFKDKIKYSAPANFVYHIAHSWILDRIGFGKQIAVPGKTLADITHDEKDKDKPLYLSKKAYKYIAENAPSVLAVTKSGVEDMEKEVSEETKEQLQEQNIELKNKRELGSPKLEDIEKDTEVSSPVVQEEVQDEKVESTVIETSEKEEEAEPTVTESSEKEEEVESTVTETSEKEEAEQDNLNHNYNQLMNYALKTVDEKGLKGKELEEELNNIGLKLEDMLKYYEQQHLSDCEKWKNSMKTGVIQQINSIDDEDKKQELIDKYEQTTGNKISDLELQENVALPENEELFRAKENEIKNQIDKKMEEERRKNAINREITLSQLSIRYPMLAANPNILKEINDENKGKFEISLQDVANYLEPISDEKLDTQRQDFINLVASADADEVPLLLGGTEGYESNRYGVTMEDIKNCQNGNHSESIESEIDMGKSR